jgi:hypothetical protein
LEGVYRAMAATCSPDLTTGGTGFRFCLFTLSPPERVCDCPEGTVLNGLVEFRKVKPLQGRNIMHRESLFVGNGRKM